MLEVEQPTICNDLASYYTDPFAIEVNAKKCGAFFYKHGMSNARIQQQIISLERSPFGGANLPGAIGRYDPVKHRIVIYVEPLVNQYNYYKAVLDNKASLPRNTFYRTFAKLGQRSIRQEGRQLKLSPKMTTGEVALRMISNLTNAALRHETKHALDDVDDFYTGYAYGMRGLQAGIVVFAGALVWSTAGLVPESSSIEAQATGIALTIGRVLGMGGALLFSEYLAHAISPAEIEATLFSARYKNDPESQNLVTLVPKSGQ